MTYTFPRNRRNRSDKRHKETQSSKAGTFGFFAKVLPITAMNVGSDLTQVSLLNWMTYQSVWRGTLQV
jgi:hypothetical protein